MRAEQLVEAARAARTRAYAPYSGCRVGAALLTAAGKVYSGCNIENAAFSPTCCAERVALFQAVAQGERDFAALAVVGGAGTEPEDSFPPCGVCRQALAEFCPPEMPIYLGGAGENFTRLTLGELLPYSFGGAHFHVFSKKIP